jgi:hypothetical protein
MTQIHETDNVYQLQQYGARPSREFKCIVVVPETVSIEMIQAAWSNAVRYTAKGLDLPDHDAALKRLKERHPNWNLIFSTCITIPIDLSKADNDIAENG